MSLCLINIAKWEFSLKRKEIQNPHLYGNKPKLDLRKCSDLGQVTELDVTKMKRQSVESVFYLEPNAYIEHLFHGFVSSCRSFPATITSFLPLWGSIFHIDVKLDFFQTLVMAVPSICDLAKQPYGILVILEADNWIMYIISVN